MKKIRSILLYHQQILQFHFDSNFFSRKANREGYYEFLKLDALFKQSKPFSNETLVISISLDTLINSNVFMDFIGDRL